VLVAQLALEAGSAVDDLDQQPLVIQVRAGE